jgi:redox-regulated HSP33 family molecular chaperone
MAQDIAEGFIMLSPPMLRSYSQADFKTVLANLGMVTRELRQEQIPLEEIMALKFRNMKLSRLHQAEVVVRAYCKKRRIHL